MKQLKKDYQGGDLSLIVWIDKDRYTVLSSLDSQTISHRYLEIQQTPSSEIIGAFFGLRVEGFKAVSERLYDNMLADKEKPLALSDLEEVLCEKDGK